MGALSLADDIYATVFLILGRHDGDKRKQTAIFSVKEDGQGSL